jgi:hypothetical protein
MTEIAAESRGALAPGAVVLIGDASNSGLLPVVAIRSGDGAVTVVPLSAAVEFATEWDLEIPADELGYRAIAEVWNYGTVLREQCLEVVAMLATTTVGALEQLCRAARSGSPIPDGLAVGPPVLADDDPRLLFQDSEADVAHSFWEPALALAGAATFGELLRHRREELHVEKAELEATAGTDGWLAGVESDLVDLRRALPPRALARVLRRLQFGASSRLRTIVHATLEGASPRLARGEAADGLALTDSDTYLDAVFGEMEKAAR